MLIFSRKADDHLASLVKKIDEVAKADNKLGTAAVAVGGVTEDELKKFNETAKLTTPLSVAVEEAGPANYKLSEDAAVTVVIYQTRDKPTVANFAFATTEEAAEKAQEVADAAKKALEPAEAASTEKKDAKG